MPPLLSALSTAVSCSALLADAYRRMGAISPLLRIGMASPDAVVGQATGRQLAERPEVLDRLIGEEEKRIRAAYGVAPRRDVAATWVLHRYAFTVCLAMSGPWYLDRRVPRLPLGRVGYDWQERVLHVAPDGFSCLRGDLAARLPGARVLRDEEALRAELRSAVAEHLGPVLQAFRPVLRRGPRTLWGMASDELTEGIWHLGRALGEPEAATHAAEALLPGGATPYVGGAGFRPSAQGDGEPTRTRISCCLYYTVRPDEVCATCPRICGAQSRN